MTVKHQRSCSTCEFVRNRAVIKKDFSDIIVESNDYKWYLGCTNPNGVEYKATIKSYDPDLSWRKGRECHVKKGEAVSNNNNTNDYVEYQKGSVKLRLANNKMTLTLNAQNVPFNSVEKRKIEQDLSDVFEVVTLASEKIPTSKEVSSTKGVEL